MTTALDIAPQGGAEIITITAPNMKRITFQIVGTAPYVQHRFGEKARKELLETMLDPTSDSKSKSAKRKNKPKDLDKEFFDATHLTADGKYGIPASAIRNACISACRVAGFVMTRAKLSIRVLADGIDEDDGSPLFYINGKPEMHKGYVRFANGMPSITARPMWREWDATLRIEYDGDQFTASDVTNLLLRAGMQVGIGEGRADSRKSNGMGWGYFEIKDQVEIEVNPHAKTI